jgi:hypothetical protein
MILKYGTVQNQSSQDDANFCLCQGPLAVVASWERMPFSELKSCPEKKKL